MKLPSRLLRYFHCAVFAMFAASATAHPGDLDLFFNPTGAGTLPGTVISTPLNALTLYKIALLPNGKILTTGTIPDQRMLLGWLPDGSLDPAFGNGGIALSPAEGPGIMNGIAVQPDGKVLVACTGIDAGAVLRFLPDGKPDPAFGDGGKVMINLPDNNDEIYTLALLSDGGILVGGAVPDGVQVRPRLWKLLPDGHPDQTFGSAGEITLLDPGAISELVEQPDGKIVATGAGAAGQNAWVGRLKADGALDPAFGGTGRFSLTHPNVVGRSTRLALQSDGKVVLGGSYKPDAGDFAFFVSRFNHDGSPDPGFNGTGQATTNLTAGSDFFGALSLQADGKVLVAATSKRNSATIPDTAVLVRYLPNGILDAGFGDNGIAKYPIPTGNGSVSEMEVQPDGKILLGGNASDPQTNRNGLLLMRVASTSHPESLSGEWPAGTPLQSGGTVNVGFPLRGDPVPAETTLTLRNTGPAPLTNLSAVIGGPGAAHFTLLSSLPSALNSGESVTLKAGYLAGPEASSFAASLTIETGDPAIEDFLIVLRGETLSPVASLLLLEGGAPVLRNATMDFAPALATHPVTKVFTIGNTGNVNLLIQDISLGTSGTPEDFTVGAPETDVLAPSAFTTFPVTFTPGGPGARTARLRITSTDTFNPPYEITVAGSLATGIDAWRMTHFGTTVNEGDAADAGDPDHDGTVNLMEYATLTEPGAPNPPPGQVTMNNDFLGYTFMRPADAPDHLLYTLERTASLQEPWVSTNAPLSVLSDDGTRQRVKFSLPAANNPRGFMRLRVSRK